MDNALVLFSRLPIGRETKTRLAPLLGEREREQLHRAMWADVFSAAVELQDNADVFLYWTGSGKIEDYAALIPPTFHLHKQCEGNLGERMRQAMRDVFEAGYGRAVLIGTDIPSVSSGDLRRVFEGLRDVDVVLGPSLDGGYWAVGMRRLVPETFSFPSWGGKDVLHATVRGLLGMGVTCTLADTLLDIDTPEDIRSFLTWAHSNKIVSATVQALFHIGISLP
ncbi:MAG: TIGR04282 family arsenosugar biosynthesis glycosyltransferase [Fretibacterium sp.]|nr:TIGR04282 family arsenosugar biosynthesis glycosyltransferase [Fretibacterium sp.]